MQPYSQIMNAKLQVFTVGAVLMVTGCDRQVTKRAHDQSEKPQSFNDTNFTSVTPTADGGAYAIGLNSGLWYLRGAQAVKVRFLGLPDDTDTTFFAALEITPTLDGGAYATSFVNKAVWHLHTDTAERVAEAPSLSSMPPVTPLSAFPLYVAERQKRLAAEQQLEERPNPDDQPEPEQDWGP
jgi:hypothetical protein